MRKKLILSAALIAVSFTSFAQVGVGTTSPEGALDVVSTDSGFLMPRMADENAVTTPVEGMQVYNTTTKKVMLYDGTAWVAASGDGSKWSNDATNTRVALTNLSDGTTARPAGTEFVVTDAGNVGIGTESPASDLHIYSPQTTQFSGARIYLTANVSNNLSHATTSFKQGIRDAGSSAGVFQIEQRNNAGVFVKEIAQYDYGFERWMFRAGATPTNILGIYQDKVYSSQNVGIGELNPARRLHVSSDNGVRFNRDGNFGTYIEIFRNNSKAWVLHGGFDNANDSFAIRNASDINVLTAFQNGNVGIGTTTPNAKLSVVGLVEYADDAAAGAAGLTAGDFYHTAGVVKVKL